MTYDHDPACASELGGSYCTCRSNGGGVKPTELVFKALDPNATLPRRGYHDDAGVDLFAANSTIIGGGEFKDISMGVAVGLPNGYWARITGRSSTLRQKGLLVNEGIIDTGYTGLLYAGVKNLGLDPVRVGRGDRIAQLIVHKAELLKPMWGELPETLRGKAGFGSTGT